MSSWLVAIGNIGSQFHRHAAWERFVPFLAFPPELRKVIYTTNAIEAINRQIRKVIKTKGHFPSDESIIKILFHALKNASKNRIPFTGRLRTSLRSGKHGGTSSVSQVSTEWGEAHSSIASNPITFSYLRPDVESLHATKNLRCLCLCFQSESMGPTAIETYSLTSL